MKHLSWRRSDIRDDFRKLPMIWRATLGIIVVIMTTFVKYLTEVLNLTHDSWTYVLVAAVYGVAMVVALRFLGRKFSN
jgi:nicotinamide riboside transporter PnuC